MMGSGHLSIFCNRNIPVVEILQEKKALLFLGPLIIYDRGDGRNVGGYAIFTSTNGGNVILVYLIGVI